MSPLPRLPLADPLLEDQSDRLALTSEKALLRRVALLEKKYGRIEKLNARIKAIKHENDAMEHDLVNAYHGADSRATRLDGQNTRLAAQLQLAEERGDELEEENTALEEQNIDLLRRLAESEREVARLKTVEKDEEAQNVGAKRKHEVFSSVLENGPDADESASVVKEEAKAGPGTKFFENLVCGMPKPQARGAEVEEDVAVEQEDAIVEEEEEPSQKKARRRRHREGPSNRPSTDAVLEKEADVEETVGA